MADLSSRRTLSLQELDLLTRFHIMNLGLDYLNEKEGADAGADDAKNSNDKHPTLSQSTKK